MKFFPRKTTECLDCSKPFTQLHASSMIRCLLCRNKPLPKVNPNVPYTVGKGSKYLEARGNATKSISGGSTLYL